MLHNVMLCTAPQRHRCQPVRRPWRAPILPTSPQPSRCFMMPAHRRGRVVQSIPVRSIPFQVWG